MAETALARADETAERRAASAVLRRTMVERQLETFGVTDIPVLRRFLDVPREAFLPPELAPLAYSDLPVVLKDERGRKVRYLLPPLILARFVQGAEIGPSDKVLDVAGGAGYSAAILSGLAREVVALESAPDIAAQAKANLEAAGLSNVRVEVGPLDKGVARAGPFDVILVHGAVEDDLDALFDSLSPDGRLLAIAKPEEGSGQQVVRFERVGGKPAGSRALFDASAPVLPGFGRTPVFSF